MVSLFPTPESHGNAGNAGADAAALAAATATSAASGNRRADGVVTSAAHLHTVLRQLRPLANTLRLGLPLPPPIKKKKKTSKQTKDDAVMRKKTEMLQFRRRVPTKKEPTGKIGRR